MKTKNFGKVAMVAAVMAVSSLMVACGSESEETDTTEAVVEDVETNTDEVIEEVVDSVSTEIDTISTSEVMDEVTE